MSSNNETREHLIDHALMFFAANDYDHSSLDEIAGALGVTKGAIYHYFDGKDQLFKAAVQRLLQIMIEWMAGTIENALSLEEYLTTLFDIDKMVADLGDGGGLAATLCDYQNVSYTLMAGIKKFPELRSDIRRVYDIYQRDLLRKMREAAARGEIRDDIDLEAVAYEVTAFYEGALMLGAFCDTRDPGVLGPRVLAEIWRRLAVYPSEAEV